MGGRCNELIGGIPQFGTDSIHGVRYIFWRVARHVLLDRIAEQLAPRFLGSPREPLCSVKDIVRNGNRRLHTISITAADWGNNLARSRLLRRLFRFRRESWCPGRRGMQPGLADLLTTRAPRRSPAAGGCESDS